MKKPTFLLAIVLVVVSLGWLSKDRLYYHYNVWQLAHAVEETKITEYNDKIQALSGKAGNSCFVNTYNDTKKPSRVRRAAARAMMKSDATLAEALFRQHLDSSNPDVSGMAIRDLGTIKSKKYRNEILKKMSNANELIRWSVVDYLGNFQDA